MTLHYVTPAELVANPNITVAVAAQKLLGNWGYGIISLTAVLAFISGINATFYSMFRIGLALSQRGGIAQIISKTVLAQRHLGRCGCGRIDCFCDRVF